MNEKKKKEDNPLKPIYKLFNETRTLTLLDLAFLVLYALFLGALLTVLNYNIGLFIIALGVIVVFYKIVEKIR